MMPEQVWDEPNSPSARLQLGKPAGSAVPLVWAHAEYLKLLRSAVDGKVFDRIEPVYERYCEPERPEEAARAILRSTRRRPDPEDRGAGARCASSTKRRFAVTWSTDDWKTVQTRRAAAWAAPGYSADISTATDSAGGELSWTLHWPEQDRWLGYNVNIKIEPANHRPSSEDQLFRGASPDERNAEQT